MTLGVIAGSDLDDHRDFMASEDGPVIELRLYDITIGQGHDMTYAPSESTTPIGRSCRTAATQLLIWAASENQVPSALFSRNPNKAADTQMHGCPEAQNSISNLLAVSSCGIVQVTALQCIWMLCGATERSSAAKLSKFISHESYSARLLGMQHS